MNRNIPERRLKIGIRKQKIINSYISETISILNQKYSIYEISFKNISIFFKIFFRRYDFFIDNWSENLLVDKKGKIKLSRIIVYICYKAFLKFISNKVIYIKHNIYPHSTADEDITKVRYVIDKLEFLNDLIVTHSDRAPYKKYNFIPHPLYKFKNKIFENELKQKNYFVIFGRILRYKNIDKYIKSCPDNVYIIIAGESNDQNYLDELKNLSKCKDNISFITESLSDDEAFKLIKNSKGLIITNENFSSVVSGTLYFGLSVGTNILSLSNPFIDWFSMKYELDCIYKYSDLNSLFDESKKIKNFQSNKTNEVLKKHFSEQVILEHWMKLIER